MFERLVDQKEALVIFDVGANNGSSFDKYIKSCPNWTFYAFEPTPELVETLTANFKDCTNYKIIPYAVSDKAGIAKFNVAGQSDWGCSSLLEFNDNLSITWQGRTDFKVTKQIDVQVIRLDQFIKDNGITKIDYLHIDAQGSDLNVLCSLGDSIAIVKAGVIEVPLSDEVKLYKNQPSKDEVLDFLTSKGFKIAAIEHQTNEYNLYYTR